MSSTSSISRSLPKVSFSHIQLYVESLAPLASYKSLEESLNRFHTKATLSNTEGLAELWSSLHSNGPNIQQDSPFASHGRDVVKQLLVGFGFRVTGFRFPSQTCSTNTSSVLITSKDPNGVQIIVTAPDENSSLASDGDSYSHFDAVCLKQFFGCHRGRQGVGVLGFQTSDVSRIHERYGQMHPDLVHSYKEYDGTKLLQVYAYYDSPSDDGSKKPDKGTILRFVQRDDGEANSQSFCILPGLTPIEAKFDDMSQSAYNDHWVSNVFSRTECLAIFTDTLGFSPKVDFNAGVVAAGEAQIESTVTGNTSTSILGNKDEALKDQTQVYLPINNALSKVGHVYGFLEEIGQGVQHVASRVENLVEFVGNCNKMREITGEGFNFLNIPRSYYGVLTTKDLEEDAGVPGSIASAVLRLCEKKSVLDSDGAVALDLDTDSLDTLLDGGTDMISEEDKTIFQDKKNNIVAAILKSRYKNLYSLLRDQISEEMYMGIVRNKILVDVQGEDILLQIFTGNILQKNPGEEAPFFEMIQRVCCNGDDGCSRAIKPGCGGFGIRNFLTLFLSIEVSKAWREAADAKRVGDEKRHLYAMEQVRCLTNQLDDSNPILTEISDAMTLEGHCKHEMENALARGDQEAVTLWKEKMELAGRQKEEGSAKLQKCNARYETLMRSIREATA